jgi:hypothetical protein
MAANMLTAPRGMPPTAPDNPLTADPGLPTTMADRLQAGTSPVAAAGPAGPEISPRVPLPPEHFPADEHVDLHQMMGEAFDNPAAQHFVRVGYHVAKARHPDVHPRHLLEAARDAYHAVSHGFAPVAHALDFIGPRARQRHNEGRKRT